MSSSSVRFEIKLFFLATVLICVSMWTFHGATENQFVWDSYNYLFLHTDHISSLSAENLRWMATSLEFYNWHPLTWFSWAIDYQLYGGLDTWGFHFSNNLLHALNGVLVLVLMLVVLGVVYPEADEFSVKKDVNSLVASFLAASLFVVHPQHVESVVWVAERKDLLCQTFLLLSILAYIKFVTSKPVIKIRWYMLTFSLYFLAVLSKPMAVTFPAVLLLLDIYPLRRTSLLRPIFKSVHQQSFLSLLIEKVPFILLSMLLILLTLKAQETAISIMADLSFLDRIVNAVNSTIFYIEKFLFPIELMPHYPYFQILDSWSSFKALVIFLLFSFVTLGTIFLWRKQKRAWLIVWGFYLVTLSPVLGLIQVGSQGAADRYAYFPTLPFYFLIAAGILLTLQRKDVVRTSFVIPLVTIVISVFHIQTSKQISVWKSEFSLWSHVVELSPGSQFAHNNLGIFYKNKGDYESAVSEFEAASAGVAVPYSTFAWLAVTYMHLGRYKESVEKLVKLGMITESMPDSEVDSTCIQYNIGWNFAQLEMHQESIDLFSRVDPQSRLGVDAGVWLNELSDAQKSGHVDFQNYELPGICENLIPSRAREQRIR